MDKEVIYSVEQIQVPPELPDILKNYTKHILKTQPHDILAASAEYFSNLSKNETLAYDKKKISQAQLETLLLSLVAKNQEFVPKTVAMDSCKKAGISEEIAQASTSLGNWTESVPYLKFWALIVASTTTSLQQTLESCASLLEQTQGKVKVQSIVDVFEFLATSDQRVSPAKLDAIRSSFAGVEGETITLNQLKALMAKQQ